ncbi:hypothetical protein HP456_09770 [Bacillus haikouensis]|jgi:hypothetical protein|uniref:hypothetical protein n=1 Tax=Bacillus haikouensis TaxID=1510468 RepID=UPI001555A277|nr:hypothetical protein [Bacillus haikouensis]NQD66203.1 hypothetical protein [Bacillus haikouensis]
MKKLTEIYTKCSIKVEGMVRNERGSQTLEWIGIAAVVVIMVGVISTAFSGDTSIGKTVLNKIKTMIGQIGGGGQ